MESPRLLAALALAASMSRPALGQGTPDTPIRDTPVAGAVHLFEGAGGNIGVSTGRDGLLIVDDQFAHMAGKIEAALARLGTNRLAFVLNTHWHGDHTGGNAHFGARAVVVAHANVRQRLAAAADTPASALPVVTHDHGLSLHFNGEEIRVIAFGPGHTDGDSAVYFTGSKVLHMGDQFLRDRFPLIDVASGGDVRGFLRNVESVLAWIPEDARVIPGHGALSTVGDLRRYRDMLVEVIGFVERSIREGKTLAEIRAVGVPAKYKSWGNGFINEARWLESCYNGLGGR